jgi:predicted NodU family carbamoyl transferase
MGTKYCGHDSAICLLDTEQKTVFAISTERVTRIKHDHLDITPILEVYDFGSVDYVAHSYSDFEDKSQDGELREKMLYNKDIEKASFLLIHHLDFYLQNHYTNEPHNQHYQNHIPQELELCQGGHV